MEKGTKGKDDERKKGKRKRREKERDYETIRDKLRIFRRGAKEMDERMENAEGMYIEACKWRWATGGWFRPPPAKSIPPQCSAIAAHVHTYRGLSASIML